MSLIWATRGRTWGFRFLLDGGVEDPLHAYERAFAGTEGAQSVYRRDGDQVAVRFPDPLGRRDAAGRVIPQELVVSPPDSTVINSLTDCQSLIWPRLADAFDELWTSPRPPTPSDVERALAGDGSDC